MPLRHRSIKSNEIRAPEVPRGEAVIVGRYRKDNPKVALVNPDDLAMLEESHDLLQGAGQLEAIPLDDLALKTLALEDRPTGAVEDAARIAAILDL
jgi:hypothetical protein